MKNSNYPKFKSLLLFSIVLFFFNCKKDTAPVSLPKITKAVGVDNSVQGVLPYPFDWENANFIPTPPGMTQIPVPWGSGANRRFTDDILTDYKSVDGWVLVYNLFNTTTFPIPGYFILYNKYRGLLRIYFYLPNSTPVPSNYMTYNLSLGGTNPTSSSLLNFAGTDVVDVSTNLPAVSQIQPYQIVSTGAWYSSQFELAYDPNIQNTDYSTVNILWQINTTNITQTTLDGVQNGTLNGTIQTPASSPNIGGALVQGAFYATGSSVLTAYPNLFPSVIQTSMQTALTNGLQGVITNLLSGIFGGNSGNSQEVNLNFNTKIALTGTSTNNSQILANSFFIPGTIGNQTGPGYSPGYNNPLGVVNLTQRPIINMHTNYVWTTYNNNTDRGTGYAATSSISIDNSSIHTIFNPAVLSSANIQLLKKEVVIFPTIASTNIGSRVTSTSSNGVTEQVGNSSVYTNPTTFQSNSANPTTYIPRGIDKVAVRMTFKVTPTNGAPSSTIVKTFLADIHNI